MILTGDTVKVAEEEIPAECMQLFGRNFQANISLIDETLKSFYQ